MAYLVHSLPYLVQKNHFAKKNLSGKDQKGHITDQKGLKMYEKRQKMEFLDLKYLLFSGIGGYPSPTPLAENHFSKKVI